MDGPGHRGRGAPFRGAGRGQPGRAPPSNGRGRGQPNKPWLGWSERGPPYDVPARDADGHKTHAKASATAAVRGQKRKFRHEEDARQRELAQRSPSAGGAAGGGGEADGDAVTAADGGVATRLDDVVMDGEAGEGGVAKGSTRAQTKVPRHARDDSAPGPSPLLKPLPSSGLSCRTHRHTGATPTHRHTGVTGRHGFAPHPEALALAEQRMRDEW